MAEKKVIEIDVTEQGLNDVVEKTKSLKQQMREAQAEVAELSNKFGATSEQAVEAAKRAAELKDAIGDAKALTDAFNPDGKFNALTSSIGGALNGFQAFQGAMGLVGSDSEKLQETLLKVQSAMAFSEGVQGLLEAKDSFKQLGAVAKNALSGIKTAIGATGIGLLVIALGAIVAYWDDIKYAISGVSSEQEQLNIKTKANLDAEQEKLNTIDSQDNVLKLQGKSERDILNIKIKQIDAVIQATEAQMKQDEVTTKSQIAAAKRNKDILKGILDFITIPIKTLLQSIDSVGKAVGQDFGLAKGFDSLLDKGASLLFDPVAEAKKAEETRQVNLKAIEKLKNDRAGFQLAIQSIDKQAKEKSKSTADELKKKEADELAELQKAQLEATKTANELEILAITEKYNKLIELAKKYGQDSKDLEAKKAQEIKSVNAKELEDLVGLTARKGEQTKEQVDASINALTKKSEAEQKARDEQKVRDEEEAQAKKDLVALQINTVKGGFDLLGDLAKTFAGNNEKAQRKAFNIQKAASIASALIDTYTAAAGVFRDTKGGLPIRVLATSVAVGAGLARVAQIAKTQFNSSSASGGGGATGSVPQETQQAPNFNIVGNAGSNPLAQLGNAPLQAYVVSGEVTSAQSLDRNRVVNATL